MANRVSAVAVSRMPKADCPACGGMGAVHMTAHFISGDCDFDSPCWECFGSDVRISLPKPQQQRSQ